MVKVMRLSVLLERMREEDSLAPTPKAFAWHWATASGYRRVRCKMAGVFSRRQSRSDRHRCRQDASGADDSHRLGFRCIRVKPATSNSVMVDGRVDHAGRPGIDPRQPAILKSAEQLARAAVARSLQSNAVSHSRRPDLSI